MSSQSRKQTFSPRVLAQEVSSRLEKEYPGRAATLCALKHKGPYQLLVATILSAQCTDERVNQVTPELFTKYPSPDALAASNPEALEEIVRPTGFYHAKASNLIGMASTLGRSFGSKVPKEMEDLVTLPGVGRKTANVIRSVAYNLPGFPVDTHVARLTMRLGLTSQKDPNKIEAEVSPLLDQNDLGAFSLRLILHGRKVCKARTPLCAECVLDDICPSATP
ncbi:MAG: endonuclease III [Acidimicrobiales bacterium]